MDNDKLYLKKLQAFTDTNVKSLSIEAVPAVGRHINKKCRLITPGYFQVELAIPAGDLYYRFRDGDTYTLLGNEGWSWSYCMVGPGNFYPIDFECTSTYIAYLGEDSIELKVVARESWIQGISLILFNSNQVIENEQELDCCYRGEQQSYYKQIIISRYIEERPFCLKIYGRECSYYYGSNKKIVKTIPSLFFYRVNTTSFRKESLKKPQIIYAIYPDSFHRVSTNNTHCNLDCLTWEESPQTNRFYGGNIIGIREKLNYLINLGISTIYLTPIFPGESSHRYDSWSMHMVDPMLGTNNQFRDLIDECHNKGLKVFIEASLDHCGTNFWAFRDVLVRQEQSAYRDWFLIEKFPVVLAEEPTYRCWWENRHLPQFNLKNPEFKEYVFASYRRWVQEYHVDGIRVDVSFELGFDFLQEFGSALKAECIDLQIIGELWSDPKLFIEQSQLDGLTNYRRLTGSFMSYMVRQNCNLEQFASGLMRNYFSFSHEKMLSSWTLLSSHDTARFISLLREPRQIFNATFLQFFLPGSPVVFYGEEVGMEGFADSDNRRSMDWRQVDEDNHLLQWYRKLIRTWQRFPVLQTGDFRILEASDTKQTLVFSRQTNQQWALGFINFAEETREFELPKYLGTKQFYDGINELALNIEVILLEPFNQMLLISEEEKCNHLASRR